MNGLRHPFFKCLVRQRIGLEFEEKNQAKPGEHIECGGELLERVSPGRARRKDALVGHPVVVDVDARVDDQSQIDCLLDELCDTRPHQQWDKQRLYRERAHSRNRASI